MFCYVLHFLRANHVRHDFVEYHIDGQTIYCDASAYDLIFKECKTTM